MNLQKGGWGPRARAGCVLRGWRCPRRPRPPGPLCTRAFRDDPPPGGCSHRRVKRLLAGRRLPADPHTYRPLSKSSIKIDRIGGWGVLGPEKKGCCQAPSSSSGQAPRPLGWTPPPAPSGGGGALRLKKGPGPYSVPQVATSASTSAAVRLRH